MSAFCSALPVRTRVRTPAPICSTRHRRHVTPAEPRRAADRRARLCADASATHHAKRFGTGVRDLLVVGAGALGLRAARQWRERHPDARVMCATWSDVRHEALAAEGFIPVLSGALGQNTTAPYVLFCAPPSGRQETPAYVADIRRAAALATRRFVFTSATSVYIDDDSAVVREDSPLSKSPRARRMLAAEAAARQSSARSVGIVRLGLLYELRRGCHPYWLLHGEVHGGPHSVYNVVHYDDAAAAAVACLMAPPSAGDTFIAVDGRPVTSEQMVRAAARHPLYAGYSVRWGDGGYTKVVDGSASWRALGWTPKWRSFEHFFQHEIEQCAGEDKRVATSE